ncbi:MAG: hypothetical protein L0Z73_12310 [Gammaproteobacteria bacterium]|nr:hypothetical protein [Gammaproteobacteria bacterium]
MIGIFNISKRGLIFAGFVFLTGCTAEQELILPNKQQRVAATDTYRQCVAYATNQSINQNRDPEEIVRDSMDRCRTSKYAMLKDYPKSWRENFEKQIDEEILKEEIAYVVKARQGQVR